MPRNTSGVYSLPQAAFIPNSIISSAAVNSDFSDIAVALTGSLPIDGSAGMTGPFKVGSGNVGAPGIAFTSDTNTGFYLAGTHQIGWSANGVQQATFNSSGSVTWQGGATWGGAVTFNGTSTFNGATNLAGNVTFNATTYTFGAGALAGWYTAVAPKADIALIIDGGGSVITTGAKGQIHIPFPMTITAWRVMADQAGRIVIDVRRAPHAIPSVFVFCGGNAPTLSGVGFNEQVPSGWTATTLLIDDWIDFNVTGSPSSVTRVTVCLSCTRTGS